MKRESLVRGSLGLCGLAWLGCSAGAVDEPVAARAQSLSAGQPDSDSSCNCITFPPSVLEECPADRLFCNSWQDCRCEAPGSESAAQSPAMSLAPLRAVQRRSRLVAPGAELSSGLPGDELRLATEGGEGLGELTSTPPSSLPCTCFAGTPSPPEGGCALEDWYCNPSGRCRCDN